MGTKWGGLLKPVDKDSIFAEQEVEGLQLLWRLRCPAPGQHLGVLERKDKVCIVLDFLPGDNAERSRSLNGLRIHAEYFPPEMLKNAGQITK